MTDPKTLVFRICAGCDTPLGLQLLPWAGVHFESSHTLCSSCDDRVRAVMGRNLDDDRPFDVRPAA